MELQRCWCLFTVLIAGFVCSSEAYKFYVGGRDGWTLHPAEDYNHWAGRMRFSVHDSLRLSFWNTQNSIHDYHSGTEGVLVFKYKNGTDSVLVVNEEDYQKCNLQNPISKMEGGDSEFIFDRSGPFFFISGAQNGNNCNHQKLHVLAIKPPPAPPPPAPPPPPTPSPMLPISPPSIAPTHAPMPVLAPTPAIVPAVSPVSSPSPASSPGYGPSVSPTPESTTQAPSPSSSSSPPAGNTPVPSPTSSGNSPPAPNTPAAAPAPAKSGARRIAASASVLAVAVASVLLSLAFGS